MIVELSKGARQFRELERAIPGISKRTLTLTTKRLCRDGLVDPNAYPTIPPVRCSFPLTCEPGTVALLTTPDSLSQRSAQPGQHVPPLAAGQLAALLAPDCSSWQTPPPGTSRTCARPTGPGCGSSCRYAPTPASRNDSSTMSGTTACTRSASSAAANSPFPPTQRTRHRAHCATSRSPTQKPASSAPSPSPTSCPARRPPRWPRRERAQTKAETALTKVKSGFGGRQTRSRRGRR
jgi:hypothetical protein